MRERVVQDKESDKRRESATKRGRATVREFEKSGDPVPICWWGDVGVSSELRDGRQWHF